MNEQAFQNAKASVEMETGKMKPELVALSRQLALSNIDYSEFLQKVTDIGLQNTINYYRKEGSLE